jgi:MarR family transcriptional regulator, organic hydroperoxide resistance regulator
MRDELKKALQERQPGETPKLEFQLCFALYAASRATIDIYRPLLDELGITYPQYLVLLILWERGTCSIKEIGHLLHLDSGTLSPLLKRLEAADFIRRQRRTEDERIVDISLTGKGLTLKSQAASIAEKFACEVGLTFEEYINLMTSLKQLTERLYSREMAQPSS